MTEQEFKSRTKQIAIRIIRLVEELPRSTCRGKSRADVTAKLAIVEEEADESIYWIELLVDANLLSNERVTSLRREIGEILAMTVASIKTLRKLTSRGIQNPKSKI